jgi:hypothetical protein
LFAAVQNHILYNRRLRRIVIRARAAGVDRDIIKCMNMIATGGFIIGLPLIAVALFA